ncbi:hypothetical protein ACTHGU_13230 [Chitinophagaceae bacterium MMS25-I14]
MNMVQHPASFRDPSGYVFRQNDKIYRLLRTSYVAHYDRLLQSGLYDELVKAGKMIAHTEEKDFPGINSGEKVLLPQQISFWTYPYEWSFEQYRAAALLTLELCIAALDKGMILKDATAYNIQFVSGKPLLIDSLSFEIYEQGKPWQAFRQFCEQFLYPLLLHAHLKDFNPALLQSFADGVPATFAASALSHLSRFNLNHWLYLFLPAKLAMKKDNDPGKQHNISQSRILQNLQQLHSFIKKLKHHTARSEWNNYYTETILSSAYLQDKAAVVASFLTGLSSSRIIDAGCNTGEFSVLAATYTDEVISFDTDPLCIDVLHKKMQEQKISNITAVVADICHPSPAGGWMNGEQSALLKRLPGDTMMALAVIHHLAISKNVPLDYIIEVFAAMATRYLIIEFVPKSDPKVQLLLQARVDIFHEYTQENFEAAAAKHFAIRKSQQLKDSSRILYLMEKLPG